MSMKNSSHTIGNWTRDPSVCIAVPQPLRHSVPHIYIYILGIAKRLPEYVSITFGPPYLLNQSTRFQLSEKVTWKRNKRFISIKTPAKRERGRNLGKSSSPNAPNTWLIFLCPLTHASPQNFPPFCFSLFALVAALSHCLCSESHCLSIKLYRIYVCYTNITLYIAFGITHGFA
jgi:hypothetical protein